MIQKQKRRLASVRRTLELIIDHGHATDFATHKLEQAFEELTALAAEAPPKCGTCKHYAEADYDDMRCVAKGSPLNGIVDANVPPDFGCVLHSEYEE